MKPIPTQLGKPKRLALRLCPVSGKHSFASETAAKAATIQRMNRGARTKKLRAYQCPDCHRWHMTSSIEFKTMPRSRSTFDSRDDD
jgi:hypothetical protein